MRILYAKAAVKTIESLDRTTKQRIKKAVEGLPGGDVRPLSGSRGLYRLRVGDWRVVFSYPAEDVTLIERIKARGDVYQGGLLCL